MAQRKEPISVGPEPAWPSTGKSTSGGNYFPPHPPACRTNVLLAGGKRRKPK